MKVNGIEFSEADFSVLIRRLKRGHARNMELVATLEGQYERPGQLARIHACMRAVDRWTQRERKAGRIKLVNREWVLAEQEGRSDG